MNYFKESIILLTTLLSFTLAIPNGLESRAQLSGDSCQNYKKLIEKEFIPIFQADKENIPLFLVGYDKSDRNKAGEKFYICKVNYDGRVFIGRGHGSNKCWFADGQDEAHIRSGYSVLRQPKDVKFVWKNVTTLENVTDQKEMFNILKSEQAVDLNKNTFFGRCVDDQENWKDLEIPSQRFMISQEFPLSMIIPGLINFDEKNNSTRLQMTWDSVARYCKTFETLVCQQK